MSSPTSTTTKIISQILPLHVGKSFFPTTPKTFQPLKSYLQSIAHFPHPVYYGRDPKKPAQLYIVLNWPSRKVYEKGWKGGAEDEAEGSFVLKTLLRELTINKKDGDVEVIATVAFDGSEEVRKALKAKLFQICTIDLKDDADRKSLEGSLLKTFTDCYEAPGFTGGDWGPDLDAKGERLNWYFLGWDSRELHDVYQATPLFWVEVDKLMPHMKGGWAHFIELQEL